MSKKTDKVETRTVTHEGDVIRVRIPMRFRRRNGRKKIVLPPGVEDVPPEAEGQAAIVTALARAFAWQEMLETGQVEGITALADKLGVDRRYVGRILQLANLAPDIVKALLNGNEPDGPSLTQLVKALPMEWGSQREALGFAHESHFTPAG